MTTTNEATLQRIGELADPDVDLDDRDALLVIADIVRDIDGEQALRNTVRAILMKAGVPEERTWPY